MSAWYDEGFLAVVSLCNNIQFMREAIHTVEGFISRALDDAVAVKINKKSICRARVRRLLQAAGRGAIVIFFSLGLSVSRGEEEGRGGAI